MEKGSQQWSPTCQKLGCEGQQLWKDWGRGRVLRWEIPELHDGRGTEKEALAFGPRHGPLARHLWGLGLRTRRGWPRGKVGYLLYGNSEEAEGVPLLHAQALEEWIFRRLLFLSVPNSP